MRIVMFRSMVWKARRALLPHCAADDRESDSCDVRTSAYEAHRQAQLAMLAVNG